MTRGERDPMETTHPPPDGWRCDAHDDLMRSVGRIEGSVDGLGKSLDILRTETRAGFGRIEGMIGSVTSQRDSDARRLASLAAVTSEGQGGVKLASWALPLIVGTLVSIIGIAAGAAIAFWK